ncbi:hypothetical protein ACFVZ3_34520 [Kitasatospora purpeofusca]|uniref:EF-Tu C-terminal domain-related protein n=1 Tax=Kitasatospora purpeofusca TaxID=67352 RepID=UPI003698212D
MPEENDRAAHDEPFLMSIRDVHALPQGGVALLGRIEHGSVEEGDDVEIVGAGISRTVKCAGVEKDRTAQGDQGGRPVGVRLLDVAAKDIEVGHVLARPGSYTPRTTFKANVRVRSADEAGGNVPITTDSRFDFLIRERIIAGSIRLPDGTGTATPGESTDLTATLDRAIVLVEGLRFALRHGPGIVLDGTVAEVVP